MQNRVRLEVLYKMMAYMKEKSLVSCAFIFSCYQKLNWRQHIILFSSVGFGIVFVIIIGLIAYYHPRYTAYPIHFETEKEVNRPADVKRATPIKNDRENKKLQQALNQLKSASYQKLNALQAQLQAIQTEMGSLASQTDIAQLQQTALAPNSKLLHQINTMQQTLQTVIRQTAKKTWVDPKKVEKYFQLIAVQGFSDGMRAIIDVNGNQTTLSHNEICPACRGWVLKNMDFSHQSAVFEKNQNGKQTFVKLQAN